MSDRFEIELKQALKESTTKSLAGWEFTPAMRQAVLQRASAEESLPTAAAPGSSQRARSTATRPLIYVAAAAAVLFVSINMGKLLDQRGGVAETAQGEPMAAKASSPSERSDVAAKKVAPEAASQQSMLAPDQAALNVAPPVDAAGQGGGAAATKAMVEMAPPSPARLILQAPPTARLGLPPENRGEAIGIATFAGPTTHMLQMEAVQPGVTAVLTTSAIRVVDPSGAATWEMQLDVEPSLLAVGPGGEIAASTGEQVRLFTPAGKPKARLQLPAPPTALALGPDERLAAIAGDQLLLYQGAQLRLKVDQVQGGQVAFAPDGTLASLMHQGEGRQLRLYGPDGALLAQAPVQPTGIGLTFTGDGQFVLAGGQLFHRSGQLAWQAEGMILGAATLGPSGPLVAWGEQRLTLLQPADGSEVWAAEFPAGHLYQVAVSAGGDLLAVLGGDEAGPILWVLDREGGQRYAERLAQLPVDIGVEGSTLQLLMPEGLESRPLQ